MGYFEKERGRKRKRLSEKEKRERSGRRKKTLIHGYNCSILNKIF